MSSVWVVARTPRAGDDRVARRVPPCSTSSWSQPEIPPNTGNVIRLAANTGCALHLVEPLGFSMDDRLLRRAGLDYHEYAGVRRHASWPRLVDAGSPPPERLFAFTTEGQRASPTSTWSARRLARVRPETAGLPGALRTAIPPAAAGASADCAPGQRSLEPSNAVAVAVFEA